MRHVYTVNKVRLPLPIGPLSEGHPERSPTVSALPDTYDSEVGALQRAQALVQEGYGISIKTPEGLAWSHEQILRRLNNMVSGK
jgi:hypothetical protein